ncbi:stage II sporulation protein M [Bacteroides fragilis]
MKSIVPPTKPYIFCITKINTVHLLPFKNNMQGCILNVLGGGLLGIGTLFNLLLNGFCFADVCCRTYKLGMSITDIFALTLPHSFELIGFWISGGIGLYIAWNIILFMYTDKMPTFKFYKT